MAVVNLFAEVRFNIVSSHDWTTVDGEMTNAIIRRPPTMNSRVQSQARAREVSGGHSGTVASAPCHYRPGNAPRHLSTTNSVVQ
jgi:hypothetical protein